MPSSPAPYTPYVMGIDVGVSSLGVALIALDPRDLSKPTHILDGTVVIQDGSGASVAERRVTKSQRTQHKHYKIRQRRIARTLRAHLALPAEFDDHQGPGYDTDRIALRVAALDGPISAQDLARAITHIGRNRGIRLTRVADTGDKGAAEQKKELTETRQETLDAKKTMAEMGARSPAEVLNQQREKRGQPPHKRPPVKRRKGNSHGLRFTRTQMKDELALLLRTQAPHHPGLTENAIAEIDAEVFYERPLNEALLLPSFCPYLPSERKLPIASLLYQDKRLQEEVNCLRIQYPDGQIEPLSDPQRQTLLDRLQAGETLKTAMIKKLLGIPARCLLNMEEGYGNRKGDSSKPVIKGHAVFAAINGTPLAAVWPTLSDETRAELVDNLRLLDDVEKMGGYVAGLCGLSQAEGEEIAADLSVPPGYAPMGPTATMIILEQLRTGPISHTEAVINAVEAGLLTDPYAAPDLTARIAAGKLEHIRLPYYGRLFPDRTRGATGKPTDPTELRYGRIPNMVVHKALNAIRKTVNAYIRRYGLPTRVHVELHREMKKTEQEREEDQKRIAKNFKQNEAFDKKLLENRQKPTRKNRQKLLLLERQKGRCPYSGRTISVENLFDGSFDIDHILPRSKTLDDGLNNKALCLAAANREKGNRSPAEAFGQTGFTDTDTGKTIPLAQMLKWVQESKDRQWNKQAWRFRPNAMEKFADEEKFRERYGRDNSQIAKLTARYLQEVCGDVVALNGRITGIIKQRWELLDVVEDLRAEEDGVDPAPAGDNTAVGQKKKFRGDHRHHLLDAIIVALTPRGVVQLLQTMAGEREKRTPQKTFIAKPISALVEQVQQILANTTVQQRPNRDPNGALHEQTHYRVLARSTAANKADLVVKHVVLSADSMVFGSVAAITKLRDTQAKKTATALADVESGALVPLDPADDLPARIETMATAVAQILDEILTRFDAEPDQVTEFDSVHPTTGEAEQVTRSRGDAERLGAAIQKMRTADQTNRRRLALLERVTVRDVVGPEAGSVHPRRAMALGNNAYLLLGRTETGESTWDVISRFDAAASRRSKTPPPSAVTDILLTLQQNDTVELTVGGKRQLCRLVKMSAGDVQFLPINDARPVKDNVNQNTYRVTSFKKMRAMDPVLVVRDATGRETWRSPRRNW